MTDGKRFMLVALGVAWLVAGAAGAADRPDPAPNMLKQMLTCRGVPSDADRLACFDRQVDALSGRIASGTVLVIDKVEARKAERARFGLPPSGNAAFAAKDGTELDELVGAVARAEPDGFGKWIVTLADGTRWHQIDDYPLSQTPKPGTKATVRRGALGSFKMTIGTNAAIRVRREA